MSSCWGILACRPSLAARCQWWHTEQLGGNETPTLPARPITLPPTTSRKKRHHGMSDRLNDQVRRVSWERKLSPKQVRHQCVSHRDYSVYSMTARHVPALPGCPLSLLLREGYRLIVAVFIRQKAHVSEDKSRKGGPRHHLRRRVQFVDTLPQISAF